MKNKKPHFVVADGFTLASGRQVYLTMKREEFESAESVDCLAAEKFGEDNARLNGDDPYDGWKKKYELRNGIAFRRAV